MAPQHFLRWAMFDHHVPGLYPILYEIIAHVNMFRFFLLDLFPFFSSNIALMLSWYNIFLEIPYPWASRKYLFHSIYGIASSAPMSSASIELFVFSFFFFDILIIYPRPSFPIDIVPPVCPHILSWAAYDASTHHFSIFTPSACRISGNLIVCFK